MSHLHLLFPGSSLPSEAFTSAVVCRNTYQNQKLGGVFFGGVGQACGAPAGFRIYIYIYEERKKAALKNDAPKI